MPRADSENPGDIGNLNRLGSELRGVQAEMERQLALATEQQKNASLEADRARADRQAAARETKVRRSSVGVGGTPAGTAAAQVEAAAATQEDAAAAKQAVESEAARLRLARERVAVERQSTLQLAEQVRLAAEQQRYSPTAGPALGAASRVQAVVQQEQAAQAARYQAQLQATEAARSAAAARYAVDAAARGNPQLLLGPGGGGGGTGGRPPTAGGTGGGDGPRNPIKLSEVSQLSRAEQELADRAKAATYSQGELSSAVAYNSRVIGLASNAYQKHGYLTSEFIQAAAKGEVTFRELGTQVGGTIAKFAGWTAAASAVYGALAAVSALGKGAIESANGVQLLNRVVVNRGGLSNDQVQGQIAGLSRQFNLPIDDVNQSVYGALKAFRGDLPSALLASREALFGVKVGELDAASATKYLTSIVQGFQLQAKDLPLLFDTINQAQNRFGGSSAQMTAGVAKAAGAFRLAGGDYRTLIALLQTGSRLTGRTPDAVATAVQRSAGRVLTAPGVAALKGAGLDPNLSYPQLIAQASGLAQGASKTRVEQLARALVPQGGTYAAIFAPLLQNRELYNKVFEAIDPAKSKGSATRELARVLREPGERLKQITGDAERLGVTLSRLGAGALPGALLGSLDLVLHTTDDILKVLNAVASITGPFKPLTVGALEFAAALRLLRRFDLGASLPTGTQGSAYSTFRNTLRRPEVDRERAQVLRGLEDQRLFVEQQRSKAAVSAGTYGTEAALAKQNVGRLVGEGATDAELAAAQAEYEAVLKQQLRATRLEETYREQQLITQQQITALEGQKFRTLEALQAALVASGVEYTLPGLNRPVPQGPVPTGALGRTGLRDAEARASGLIVPAGAAAPAVLAAEQEAQRQSAVARGLNRMESATAGLSAKAAGAGPILGRGAAGIGILGGAVANAGRAAEAATVGFVGWTKRAYEGLGALERGGLVLGALYADYKLISSALDRSRQDRVTNAINRGDLGRATIPSNGFFGNLPIVGRHGFFGSGGGLLRNAQDVYAGIFGGQTPDQQAREEAAHAAAAQAALGRAQQKGTLLYQGPIQDQLRAALGRAGNNVREQQAAIQKALDEEAHSYAATLGTGKERDKAKRITDGIKAQLAVVQAVRGQLQLAIASINDAGGLDAFIKGIGGRGDIGDSTPFTTARGYGFATARARELLGTGQLNSADAAQRIQAADQGAQKALEDELNRKLSLAGGNVPAQGAARGDYISKLRETRLGPIRAEISRLEADTKQFPDHARQNRQALSELRKGLAFEQQQIAATVLEQRQAQFDAAQKVYDARTQLLSVQANDPVVALRIQLRRDTARLAAKAERYGKDSAEYLQALSQAAQERQQLVSAVIDRYSSEQDLYVAQTTVGASTGAKNAAQLAAAQRVLGFTRTHGGTADQIRQASIAVYNAEDQIASQVQQDASSLADAEKALALSRLDPSNKVAAALVSLRFDRLAVARAKTPADKINAQAQLNTDAQSYRDARLGAAYDRIQFNLQMDRIDNQTAALEIQALAARVKHNRALKQQYLTEAHSLQKQAEGDSYALDISNVRIPTPYEVTRAIREGRRGTSQYRQSVVNQDNKTSIHIVVKDNADLAKVGDVLDTHLNTNTRSALRAQGVLS